MSDELGERTEEPTAGGFLPPQPPGPEPDLDTPPVPAAPPPATWPQYQQQPPPPGWQLAPPVPGNSQAVAGFVLSVVAAALLVVSLGLSSIVSLALAVLGMVLSSKGRKNVDEGRTPKHRELARAGFITGIVTLVLTVLATAAWVAVALTSG